MNILDWISKNSDLVLALTAVLALVTSSVSIYVANKMLKDQRHHNRISVRPIANFSISDYENKLSVSIENRGTGPLIIDSFIAECEGQTKTSLIEWMPALPKGVFWSTFFQHLDGFAILPEKSINLLEFSPDMKNRTHSKCRDQIRKALSKITVKINYSDIYGMPMPLSERSLAWFGRHSA
jgi:hypothetical protein